MAEASGAPSLRPRPSKWARDESLPQIQDGPVAPHTAKSRRIALGVLLMLSFLAVAKLAAPVWLGILLGALMAFTAQPLYRVLCMKLGGRRRSAAFLTTLLTGATCVATGAVAIFVLTRELVVIIGAVQGRLGAGTLAGLVGESAASLIHRTGISEATLMTHVDREVNRATLYAADAAGLVLQTTASAAVGLVIGSITMYHVLVDWPAIPLRLERVLPLEPRHTRALVLEFREVGRSALMGTLATALLEGAMAALGFAFSDLPHALTWGVSTALSSFVPVVGTALVWADVSIYYLWAGRIGDATFQLAWGLVVIVGIGDYVIRPRLVGPNGRKHPLLMLVAALGGMQVFGLAGIIVGPVLMSLFLAILAIYERDGGAAPSAGPRPASAASDDEH